MQSPHNRARSSEDLIDWLALNTKKAASGCIEWRLHKFPNGYGRMHARGVSKKQILAHRFSYQSFVGSIPEGMNVLHECDNRACVNPAHLKAGTQKKNIQDMVRRGRSNRTQPAKGERNGSSKLKNDDVLVIRRMHADGMAVRSIAKAIGCCKSTVHNVVSGLYWNHVKEDDPCRN